MRLFVTTARALARAGFAALRFDFMGSGDSSGEFCDMSPTSEIADLKTVIAWARRRGFRTIGLLGLSMGGAVSICTAAQLPRGTIHALVTWSSVPGFGFWMPRPAERLRANAINPTTIGNAFYDDRPLMDVRESYLTLDMPKLQIQGDNDIAGFREEFAGFFPRALPPKKHVIIPGADHTFNSWPHRRKAIDLTVAWFARHLG